MTEDKGADLLAKARAHLADGEMEPCLAVLKEYWLENPYDPEAASLLSQLMHEAGRSDLSNKLQVLSEKLSASLADENPEDKHAQEMFEVGYGLIDVRQHELAAMLLNRCASVLPDEPTVNYELGFSLMSLGRYADAIKYFQQAVRVQDDFDTRLNLTVCFTLARQLQDAKNMLEVAAGMAQSEEERAEVNHRRAVFTRLERLGNRQNLTHRDWMFVLYGSILLFPGVRKSVTEDLTKVALMLATLRGLLEGLNFEIEVCEYYSLRSRPLARILSESMEISDDSYRGPERPDRAILLMAWATDVIGPHAAFIPNTDKRCLFSYAMTMTEPLPVVPDIVGFLADDLELPWFSITDSRTQSTASSSARTDEMIKRTLDRARDLDADTDILNNVQEAIAYYSDKREFLVLGNTKRFPMRPEYTAEFPC